MQWQRQISGDEYIGPSGSRLSVVDVAYSPTIDRLWCVLGLWLTSTNADTSRFRLARVDPATGLADVIVDGVYPSHKVPGSPAADRRGKSLALLPSGQCVVLGTEDAYTSGTYPDLYAYVVDPDGQDWTRFLVAASPGTDPYSIVAIESDVVVSLAALDQKRLTTAGSVVWTSTENGYAVAVGSDNAVLLAPRSPDAGTGPNFRAATLNGVTGALVNENASATASVGYCPGVAMGSRYVLGDAAGSLVRIVSSSLVSIGTVTGGGGALGADSSGFAAFVGSTIRAYDVDGAERWRETMASSAHAITFDSDGDVYVGSASGFQLERADAVNPW